MSLLTFKVQKEPGFRFNLTDLIFIILLVITSISIYNSYGRYYSLYLLPLYVGSTFFLFCNVFRVGTRLELVWIVSFLLISIASHHFFSEQWLEVSAICSSAVQAIEIFLHTSSKNYRGLFHERFNPQKRCTFKPYDPSWLVKAAQPYKDEFPWLLDALKKCIQVCDDDAAYFYFVESENANQPGSVWQIQENITLEETPEGEIILDIIKPNIVGGVEFYDKLD